MVEYDFFIALEHAVKVTDGIYEMRFPKSAVLYLRHTSKTPDAQKLRIIFADGKSIEYDVPIIKTQLYTADNIIEKKLYFLIPYYILKYENIDDDSCLDNIAKEYNKIYCAMQKSCEEGIINEYDVTNVHEFTDKLIKYVANRNKYIKKEAEKIMGGAVLETMADRLIREGEEKEVRGEIRGRILTCHEFGLSDEEIADRVGKDIEYVKQVIAGNNKFSN